MLGLHLKRTLEAAYQKVPVVLPDRRPERLNCSKPLLWGLVLQGGGSAHACEARSRWQGEGGCNEDGCTFGTVRRCSAHTSKHLERSDAHLEPLDHRGIHGMNFLTEGRGRGPQNKITGGTSIYLHTLLATMDSLRLSHGHLLAHDTRGDPAGHAIVTGGRFPLSRTSFRPLDFAPHYSGEQRPKPVFSMS